MGPNDTTAVLDSAAVLDNTAFLDNTAAYEVPVDPMDDLWCESCQ